MWRCHSSVPCNASLIILPEAFSFSKKLHAFECIILSNRWWSLCAPVLGLWRPHHDHDTYGYPPEQLDVPNCFMLLRFSLFSLCQLKRTCLWFNPYIFEWIVLLSTWGIRFMVCPGWSWRTVERARRELPGGRRSAHSAVDQPKQPFRRQQRCWRRAERNWRCFGACWRCTDHLPLTPPLHAIICILAYNTQYTQYTRLIAYTYTRLIALST